MRQKKYTSLIAFSVILLFIIAGCKGGGKEKDLAAQKNPFLGGIVGLDIKFEKESPPAEVSDGGDFPFQAVVSLENKGEFDLKKEQVKISLTGFDPNVFGVNDPNVLFDQNPDENPEPRIKDAEGKVIEPVKTSKTFPTKTAFFNVADIVGKPTFNFRANVCYLYQTKAISYLCVLENLVNPASNAICEPADTKDAFSSGSPIAVTSLEQSVRGNNNIRFSFLIKHSGKGRVFSGDASNAASCPTDPSGARLQENWVNVGISTGTLTPNLRCDGLEGTTTGDVKLVNNERLVTCTQDLDTNRRGDFPQIVEITLDFNYLDIAEAPVTVKDVFTPSEEEAASAGQGAE